jgi:benzoyl-CoA reductase/2-hydroxyglutaryl-CoA dehydratase subunit BcrC/BadD/HgdB
MTTIGITTTVPTEVLLAAGLRPVDLNNLFIADPNPDRLVNIAERAGFPQNCCTWIKGIYGTCLDRGIDTVLCVTSGDCSNTLMLMEVLKLRGLGVIPFAYPDQPDVHQMRLCLEALADVLGTTLAAAGEMRGKLEESRSLALELDELTWRAGVVGGWENHLWLVTSSDFNGDYREYQYQLQQLLSQCRKRQPHPEPMLRLAYIGVPPTFASDLYRYLERHGARVGFNESQRQFAMPQPSTSLAEQYSNYTYPYPICHRVSDVMAELRRRQVDGVVHYVQAFCHRGIADIIFRHAIELPILTLEGNDDYMLSHHLRTRIEAFLDMLKRRQRALAQAH